MHLKTQIHLLIHFVLNTQCTFTTHVHLHLQLLNLCSSFILQLFIFTAAPYSSRPSPGSFTLWKETLFPMYRRLWVGPWSSLVWCSKSCAYKIQSPDPPVCSEALYLLCWPRQQNIKNKKYYTHQIHKKYCAHPIYKKYCAHQIHKKYCTHQIHK